MGCNYLLLGRKLNYEENEWIVSLKTVLPDVQIEDRRVTIKFIIQIIAFTKTKLTEMNDFLMIINILTARIMSSFL